jgi:hypothetical protein
MMGRMKTPKQSDLMSPIMVKEMTKLPDDISINKPVPGKFSMENSIGFQQSYDKNNHGNGYKSTNHAVKNIN